MRRRSVREALLTAMLLLIESLCLSKIGLRAFQERGLGLFIAEAISFAAIDRVHGAIGIHDFVGSKPLSAHVVELPGSGEW